jgi:hypothetical protein
METLEVFTTVGRGFMWGGLLAFVALTYAGAGLHAAAVTGLLFYTAFVLGTFRPTDKEIAAVEAKLDELRRRIK